MGYLDNLVSWWDMSNINPPDLGFRQLGNDGVGIGLVTATDIANGVGGGMATEFDGSEYVRVTAHASLNLLSSGSVACWYRVEVGSAGFRHLFAQGAGYWSALLWDTDELRGVVGTTAFNSAYIPPEGVWHHLVMAWDGTNVSVFNDGAFLLTVGQGVGGTPGDFVMGANAAGTQRWFGVLDEVMIFNAALTNLQVTDLWNRTRRGQL